MKFSSIRSLQACLARGNGVTICPRRVAADAIASGELAIPAWEENNSEVPVLMIWHKEKWCSRIIRDFMDITMEQMAADPKGQSHD